MARREILAVPWEASTRCVQLVKYIEIRPTANNALPWFVRFGKMEG